jgi:hypothetical protein
VLKNRPQRDHKDNEESDYYIVIDCKHDVPRLNACFAMLRPGQNMPGTGEIHFY